jgi:hypothetical protein
MISTYLAWNDVVDVHLTLISSTLSTDATISAEHAFALRFVTPRVQLI